MARQTLNTGNNANDGLGDDLRTAMQKIEANFVELYNETAVDSQLTISGNKISANQSNASVQIEGNGTGDVLIEGIKIHDNEISTHRSNDTLFLKSNGTGDINIGSNGGGDVRVGGSSDVILNPTDDVLISPTDDVKLIPTDSIFLAPGGNIGIFSSFNSSSSSINWNRKGGSNFNTYTTANDIDTFFGTGTTALPEKNTPLFTLRIHGVNTAGAFDPNNFAEGVELLAETGVDWAAGSNYGSMLTIKTVKSGETTTAERIKIDVDGSVNIGSLNFNSGTISTTTTNQDITLTPNGTGVVAISNLKVDGNVQITDNEITTTVSNSNLELSANSSGKVSISGLKFPTSDGSTGQLLSTDGSGNLSFVTVAAPTLSHTAQADGTATVASSATTAIDTFAHATYRSAKYLVSVTDAQNGEYETHDIVVVHNGTAAFMTDTVVKSHTDTDRATFDAVLAGSNIELRTTNGGGASVVYKFYRNLVEV